MRPFAPILDGKYDQTAKNRTENKSHKSNKHDHRDRKSIEKTKEAENKGASAAHDRLGNSELRQDIEKTSNVLE